MTVIAWDGKTLAADRRATSCGMARTVRKICRIRSALIGISGDHSTAVELLRWFETRGEFPAKARDDVATLLVIEAGRILLYTTGPQPMQILDEHMAIGSGRDYAMAAMHLGFDARRAVEVACHFEVGCGNGIDTLEFEP